MRHGPAQLIERLKHYPDPDSPTVKNADDFIFLLEILNDKVKVPVWLSSAPDLGRAKSLAAFYLSKDHSNRHFVLPENEQLSIRELARSELQVNDGNNEVRLEAIGTLAAIGNLDDVAYIEGIAKLSTSPGEVQQVLMSLALMCQPAAGDAMNRVLEAKEGIVGNDFRALVRKVRERKQQGLCRTHADA